MVGLASVGIALRRRTNVMVLQTRVKEAEEEPLQTVFTNSLKMVSRYSIIDFIIIQH